MRESKGNFHQGHNPHDAEPARDVSWSCFLTANLSLAGSVWLPHWFFRTAHMSWPLYVLTIAVTTPAICIALIVLPTVFGMIHRMVATKVLRWDIYHNVPEPPLQNWWSAPLTGHLDVIRQAEPAEAHLQWAHDLNSFVYVYRAMFFIPRLFIADVKGIMHILSQQNAYNFPKPAETRRFLSTLLGNGLVTSEGDTHKKQRKITAPAFTISTVRSFTPVYFRHTQALVRAFDRMIDQTKGPALEPFLHGQSAYSAKASAASAPVVDVGYWVGKTTLDIIGEIGFGYDFKSMESVETDAAEASLASIFNNLFSQMADLTLLDFLQSYIRNNTAFSWLDRLLPEPPRFSQVVAMGDVMASHAKVIIEEKKKQIRKEMEAVGITKHNDLSKAAFDEDLENVSLDGQVRPKDLLHITMRANVASDLRPSERLSDNELLGQMTSFLIAGHETTATQTLWALYVLADQPQIVAKLREEIDEAFGPDLDDPAGKSRIPTVDFDTLQGMTYLDAVCKEMMRLYAPVTATPRWATKDTVVPLGKSYPTRDGKGTFNSVPIVKGQEILIPIQVVNSSTDIWGPTAHEFDPSRWEPENMPPAAKESGMPSQMMTFLAGPRGCVGQRAAAAEFKVLVACLIREFDWQRINGWEVERKQGIVTRPMIKGQREVGLQMPLRVTRAKKRNMTKAPAPTPGTPVDPKKVSQDL